MAEQPGHPAPANTPSPFGPYERTPAAAIWRSDTETVVQRGHGWVYITGTPGASEPPWVQI